VVGVLVEVPLMLALVKFANRTQGWFPADTPTPDTGAPDVKAA
jgi:ACR3 family arsenite transporter